SAAPTRSSSTARAGSASCRSCPSSRCRGAKKRANDPLVAYPTKAGSTVAGMVELSSEEAVMLQTGSRLLRDLPLFLLTVGATHLAMSLAKTLMHYKLGHHPIGGKFFRNHINFHHTYYCKDHLVSRTYLGDEGNNTPFFFIPVFLVGACTYLVLPLDLFF